MDHKKIFLSISNKITRQKDAKETYITVSSGWLSVWMFLGDVGDTNMHKHDAAMMEMTACLFITSGDQVTMQRKQQLQREY